MNDLSIEKYFNTLCCTKVPIYLTNNLGETPLSYPLGVFDINGGFIGRANNNVEYANLWNSSTVNNPQGQLTVTSNPFIFQLPKETATILNVKGLRFWHVTAVSGTPAVYVDKTDYVQRGNTQPQLADTHPNKSLLTSIHGGSTLYTGVYEYNSTNTQQYVGIPISSANNETVWVYHNDRSYVAGFSDTTFTPSSNGVLRNVGGNFPKYVSKLIVKVFNNYISNNLKLNNSLVKNYLDLLDVEVLSYQTAEGGSQANSNEPVTHIPLFTHMNKLKRINLFVSGGFDNFLINKTNFPLLRAVSNPVASVSAFPKLFNNLSTLPPLTEGIDFRACGFTSADVDRIFNDLRVALDGVIPVTGAKLSIQNGNSPATSSSLASRTYLQIQGWIID